MMTATEDVRFATLPDGKLGHQVPTVLHLTMTEVEDTTTTAYKSRIIGGHISKQLYKHKLQHVGADRPPLMVGLQGPQGCGKTTMCNGIQQYLEAQRNVKVAVMSLDDLYHTHARLAEIAEENPGNALLAGRGLPGTHDTQLAVQTLSAVLDINKGSSVSLPIFDKSLHDGQGDRSTQTVQITGPIDVFILEGWSMGFQALGQEELVRRYSEAQAVKLDAHFTHHPLEHLLPLDDALSVFAPNVYPFFSVFIQIKPQSLEHILAWRLEQEHAMKEVNGGNGMSDEAVRVFVERYLPGYELWGENMSNEQWDSALCLEFGQHREVLNVIKL